MAKFFFWLILLILCWPLALLALLLYPIVWLLLLPLPAPGHHGDRRVRALQGGHHAAGPAAPGTQPALTGVSGGRLRSAPINRT